ncbi:MAG: hypothetical protein LBI84_03415 [Propionibacteriaceae bacterium]|jgi:hypothetical protein|nr:hypothetical protein [Propionibacteriaceae bacterium]
MRQFDDGRLDDPRIVCGEAAEPLRHLALAGARLRRALGSADLGALGSAVGGMTPRAVVAVGPEARLIRAVAEPVSPVPLVAWAASGLPAWVGALDLVVIVGGEGHDVNATTADAIRRGAFAFVLTPRPGQVAEHAVGRSAVAVSTATADPFVNAVIALAGLAGLGLAPAITPERVADSLDAVAENCSPHVLLGLNPAKNTTVCLADSIPLVWGGTVLAARASRRVAEAIRQASGRAALAADAAELRPVLAGCAPPDVFADPFEDPPADPAYCFVCLDDCCPGPTEGGVLEALAEAHGVRVARLRYDQGAALERYACLLQHGRFAAAYLALGLV